MVEDTFRDKVIEYLETIVNADRQATDEEVESLIAQYTKHKTPDFDKWLVVRNRQDEKGKVIPLDDDTKITIEYNELVKLFTKNLSEAEVRERMQAFYKWNQSTEEYKQRLIKNAIEKLQKRKEERERKKREADEAAQKIGIPSNILEVEEQVRLYLLARDKEKARDIIVGYLRKEEHIMTERQDDSAVMYIYRDGIYVTQARTYIREFCEQVCGAGYTRNISNEVISRIEAITYIEPEKLYEVNDPFEVPLLNGIMNLRTKELSPFTPNKIFFTKIPLNYNPEKDCPRIKAFVKQIIKEQETEAIIQELFGYLLVRNYFIPKAFLLTGVGRNGKSTLLSIFENYLSKDNVSNVPLQVIETSEYAEAELHLKYANISGDLSTDTLKNSAKFKQLTGEDSISANRKFLSRLKFKSYAKLLFAANNIPNSSDTSDGFFSRWIIIDFPNKFYTKEEIAAMTPDEARGVNIADRTIINKLTTPDELEGALNWGLEGLSRLIENGSFSYSQTTNQLKQLYMIKSNSLQAFFDQHCDTVNDIYATTEKGMFRSAYNKFCKDHYVTARTDKGISKFMSGKSIEDSKSGSMRYWVGFKLVGI